jgi:2-hydroxy-6-oxonona-2,4-dienedioate hydrolase
MSLQSFGERRADVGGVETRYFQAGDGEPVVFIHGGAFGDKTGAANAEDWDRNFPVVAESYRAISIDRLGQGLTGLPKDDASYTMAASVKHVIGLLEELGQGPYHLVGHSRGGYVACRVTLERPDLVRSCVIVDSATCAPGVERNDYVFACQPHAAFTREACLYTYKGYSYSTDHVTAEWLDMKVRLLEVEKNRVAAEKMHGQGLQETVFYPALRVDREDLFMRLDAHGLVRPTLLIWGFNDPTAPLSMGHALFELLSKRQPRTRMHTINRAGHFTYREQPAAFNRVLLEHLEAVACGA